MDVASQMKSYSGFLSHAVKRFCKLAVEVIMEPTLVCSLPNSLTHSLHCMVQDIIYQTVYKEKLPITKFKQIVTEIIVCRSNFSRRTLLHGVDEWMSE